MRTTSVGWTICVVLPRPDGYTAWEECAKLIERLLGGFYEVDQQHAAERPILFVRAHHGSHECLRQCGLPASGWRSDDVHLRHRRLRVVSVPATVRLRLAHDCTARRPKTAESGVERRLHHCHPLLAPPSFLPPRRPHRL